MKRKTTSLLSIMVVVMLLLGVCLTSCDLLIPVAKEHTLTLYDNDGTTVISTVKCESGKAPVKPEDPTKDGYVFSGWFVTPTSSKAFDFSAAMTEDAKAYAQWKTADYQDDRDWVLSGSMNGWGSKLDGYHLTKKSGTGNVYEITLDLYVDDEFQLTVLLANGTLSYSSEGARAASSHVVAGTEYMEAAGGLGTYKNIHIIQDGSYTLSLVSDPETDNNELTITRNGDPTGPVKEHEIATYAIKGSKVTGWADKTDEQYLMTKGTDGKFTLTIQLYANDEFMFVGYENDNGALVGLAEYIKSNMLTEDSASEVAAKANGNFATSAKGTYTFTFDPETSKVAVTYSSDFSLPAEARPTAWYILGNGGTEGSVLKTSSWGLNDESVQKLTDNGNGVYEITLDLYVGDEFQICSSSSWADKHGFSSLVDPGDNFTQGGNIKVAVAGNYTLTLTINAEDETKDTITWVRNGDAGEVEETEYPADTFAIKGSKVTGWADKTDEQYLMTKGTDGKFTLTIQLYANEEFMFVGYEKVGDKLSALTLYIKSDMLTEDSATEVAKSGGNFTTSANGTYTFTFDPEINKVAVTYSSDFTLAPEARPTAWYILGNGGTEGSVLKTSSWGLNDESVQKLTDKGNGVYEITLNLYVGDAFKICSNGSWKDAHDFTDMVDADTNFKANGNIEVLVEGNYTLTLTIDYNDEALYKITWVRNGDCQ